MAIATDPNGLNLGIYGTSQPISPQQFNTLPTTVNQPAAAAAPPAQGGFSPTAAAVGVAGPVMANAADPRGVGLGPAAGSAASLGATGFMVGGPIGAGIGATLGLGLGLMGAAHNRANEQEARNKEAARIMGEGLERAGAQLEHVQNRSAFAHTRETSLRPVRLGGV